MSAQVTSPEYNYHFYIKTALLISLYQAVFYWIVFFKELFLGRQDFFSSLALR